MSLNKELEISGFSKKTYGLHRAWIQVYHLIGDVEVAILVIRKGLNSSAS